MLIILHFSKKNGITHIINMAEELENKYPNDFVYYKVDLFDEPDEEIMKDLQTVYDYIVAEGKKNPKAKFFIHCYMGKSRSGSTVIYYIMNNFNLPYEKAIGYVQKKRVQVDPNDGYRSQLKHASKKIFGNPEMSK